MPEATHRTAHWVTTEDEVAELARVIVDPERTQAVVGVTSQPRAEKPFVDADALAERLGDLAQVWVITEADHAWALTEAVPDKLDVYGGAVRVWTPITGERELYPNAHPQWTVFSDEEGARVLDLIAEYVALTAEHPLPEFGTQTTGTVTAVRKAGAELDLATGHPAFASVNHLVQHGEIFHAGDVLAIGQEVPVRVSAWHAASGRLSVSTREFAPDPWDRLAEVYQPGDLIEGGVSGVTAFGAFIELLPGVEGLLHKSKIADAFVEYVDDYVQQGDRITVRLLDLDPDEHKAAVSLRGIPDGAKPVRPASVFPGGPPWLPVEGEDDGSSSDEPEPVQREAQDFDDAPAAATHAPTSEQAPAAAAPAAEEPEPATANLTYGAALSTLVSLIAQHGASSNPATANRVRDALERGISTFDARLDELDESTGDPAPPIAELRDAATALIDALRAAE